MNGTAMNRAPGTRAATVTGIHTCSARRSMRQRLTVHLGTDGPSLVGDEATEVAGVPVEGEDGDQPVGGGDVHRALLPEGIDFGDALPEATGHADQVAAHGPFPGWPASPTPSR